MTNKSGNNEGRACLFGNKSLPSCCSSMKEEIGMKYPIGIQQFEKIRKGGFVYVDKTAQVYQLASLGCYYFLSRPRRFGKSLLISTMEAYFQGKKELFEGLALEHLETEWKSYPVLHLDLNARNYENEDSLRAELNKHLLSWEEQYGLETHSSLAPEERFFHVIRRASEQAGEQVVVLVDEYDKPLLSTIDHKELHDAYRDTLKGFFGVLKSQDPYIRFAFLTGVSRFSHVSIFSDLNNLKDISMDTKYAEICGISEKELHAYFEKPICALASAQHITYEETCAKLREQYDGYHFRENAAGMYNPYSLLNTFDTLEFNDYWFRTGTPTFLVKLLKRNDYPLKELKGLYVDESALQSVDEEYMDPIPVLFQSGYLTISGHDPELGYRLDFPNQEVERGFFNFLVPYYTSLLKSSVQSFLNRLTAAVRQGKPDELLKTLQVMLAGKPYQLAGGDKEVHFQNTLYLIFMMLGYNVQVEQATSQGRMDVTLQTKDYVYILELKLDRSAGEALQQIKDNQYARPFQADSRKVFLVGVNFSSATRTVEKWVVEEGIMTE